jgi:rRNA maturation protein Nop10
MARKTDRRCFLARGVAGAAGAAAFTSVEEDTFRAAAAEGSTEAKPKTDINPADMPQGKIGDVSMSRLLIGGNLIGGWAHSRDLMYASQLFKEYNTEAKIFQTLDLCQACGINTIQMDPKCWDPIEKYNKARSTPMQTMSCIPFMEDKTAMNDTIKKQIDKGATMLYSHGGVTDSHMMKGGSMEVIAQMVELIQAQGIPAGVGGHSLNMPIQCEKQNVGNDFYVKTFHIDQYWSATPEEDRKEYDWMARTPGDHDANNDSMWCNNPEETAAFMETVEKPWVAFKVMAAGAINPLRAFPYAYKHGADFVIAGMFDFQVETDAKIAIKALPKTKNRKRKWYS